MFHLDREIDNTSSKKYECVRRELAKMKAVGEILKKVLGHVAADLNRSMASLPTVEISGLGQFEMSVVIETPNEIAAKLIGRLGENTCVDRLQVSMQLSENPPLKFRM